MTKEISGEELRRRNLAGESFEALAADLGVKKGVIAGRIFRYQNPEACRRHSRAQASAARLRRCDERMKARIAYAETLKPRNPRDQKVLDLFKQGLTTVAIGARMGLSFATIINIIHAMGGTCPIPKGVSQE